MTYRTDEEIRNDALFQLDWDSRLRWSDISVSVKKGVVTLTGTVDSYAKKLAAQKAAHSVRGVRITGTRLALSEQSDRRRHRVVGVQPVVAVRDGGLAELP